MIIILHAYQHLEYAKKVKECMLKEGFRVELDDANEKLGYRLRNSQVRKIPYTIVIGDNEVNNHSVTYRLYGTNEQITVSLDEFKALIVKSIKERSRF